MRAYEDEFATVYLGDCLEVLATLPANSVDAVVTDPPAGIAFMGRTWDTFPTRKRLSGPTFKDGRIRPGISQGQEHNPRVRDGFIAFMTEVMAECLRVLKPGGHALVWAIPRTSHWTGMAIEDAGFEVRDFVCHHYGSGFPKSRSMREIGRPELGTALKPATEIWWEARKPLSEPNVAAQVLATGTGALNIDACRVDVATTDDIYAKNPHTKGGFGHAGAQVYGDSSGAEAYDPVKGRWPANLVLAHSPDCRQVGTRKVKGITGGTGNHEGGVYGARTNQGQAVKDYADPDGTETVEAWECAPGCPVPELDRQSGIREGGHHPRRRNGLGYHGGAGTIQGSDERDVPGGASRFFMTFRGEPCESASTAGKSSSLPSEPGASALEAARAEPSTDPSTTSPSTSATQSESRPNAESGTPTTPSIAPRSLLGSPHTSIAKIGPARSVAPNTPTGIIPTTANPSTFGGSVVAATSSSTSPNSEPGGLGSAPRFIYTAKASARERNEGLPEGTRNTHPTVKPIALMRWLCRLVTPPGGVVLDPFCGSGSTGVAAVREGFRFIGIEKDAESCAVGVARIRYAVGQVTQAPEQVSLFTEAAG